VKYLKLFEQHLKLFEQHQDGNDIIREILEEFEKLSVDKKLEVLRELENSLNNEEKQD